MIQAFAGRHHHGTLRKWHRFQIVKVNNHHCFQRHSLSIIIDLPFKCQEKNLFYRK